MTGRFCSLTLFRDGIIIVKNYILYFLPGRRPRIDGSKLMKRVLKIVIPLVVVLALLGGCAWFFLAYRSDLTAHFLTGQAERMMEAGRYNRAIQYETWAWEARPPTTKRFRCPWPRPMPPSGNYTKAEYTLVNAIAATPKNVALYVELCQVYVAQDKLLDAVQMLDRVQDEAVREELAAMRPAAPELSPEDGYYTEYIEVSADGGGNNVYLSIDGEYPLHGEGSLHRAG